MAVKKILLLGNPMLYKVSEPVTKDELTSMKPIIHDLHDTLFVFRKKHGVGRAIAAPQIGIMKRLIYLYIDKPIIFINPVIDKKSNSFIEVWDDCMSFPNLLVKVKRHKICRIRFTNINQEEKELYLQDDLSELLRHEYDHLDGILAVSKAIDGKSFAYKNQMKYFI